MAVIVQKYGGSSVADVQKLRGVAERIVRTKQQGHDVVVVVSAMGDTTDELLDLTEWLGELVRHGGGADADGVAAPRQWGLMRVPRGWRTTWRIGVDGFRSWRRVARP